MTYEGRTLTLHWDDRQVVGRWSDGSRLDPVPATPAEPDDHVQWLVELIAQYRRTYPGARVRATNRDDWRTPETGRLRYVMPQQPPAGKPYVVRSALAPLHYHVFPDRGEVRQCWHHCP